VQREQGESLTERETTGGEMKKIQVHVSGGLVQSVTADQDTIDALESLGIGIEIVDYDVHDDEPNKECETWFEPVQLTES
jgi:hypothetical protein